MGELPLLIIRSIILSYIMGMSCQVFFETVVPVRKMKHEWINRTAVLAFTAGFMVIAVTKIPPYILQPVRVILIVFLVAQIYFRISVMKNLALSVVFLWHLLDFIGIFCIVDQHNSVCGVRSGK